jgi:hypothetical protein
MANPKVEPLFELRPRTIPKVRAKDGHVVIRLELKTLENPLDIRDIEITLSGRSARQLGSELIENAKKLG